MSRTLRVYKAYNFRNKEPIIDETRTMLEDAFGEKINHSMLQKIEERGGPSVSCMSSWFFGKTMRPQNVTVEACGRAAGYRRVWTKMK